MSECLCYYISHKVDIFATSRDLFFSTTSEDICTYSSSGSQNHAQLFCPDAFHLWLWDNVFVVSKTVGWSSESATWFYLWCSRTIYPRRDAQNSQKDRIVIWIGDRSQVIKPQP